MSPGDTVEPVFMALANVSHGLFVESDASGPRPLFESLPLGEM
jgi:hypothetical protein